MFTYSFYVKSENVVELQVQGPDYVVLTDILKVNKKDEGILGTCTLGSTVQLAMIRQNGCWLFGIGQIGNKVGIPGNWVINVQQDYRSKCSPLLRISSSSPIFIKKPNDQQASIDLPEVSRDRGTSTSFRRYGYS